MLQGLGMDAEWAAAQQVVVNQTKTRDFVRQNEGRSLWSVFWNEEDFKLKLLKCFDWTGQIYLFNVVLPMNLNLPDLRADLFASLEAFMDWYDDNEEGAPGTYAPAVRQFEALRDVIVRAQQHMQTDTGHERYTDSLRTLQRLQRDIDEIVGHIRAKMEAQRRAAPTSGVSLPPHTHMPDIEHMRGLLRRMQATRSSPSR